MTGRGTIAATPNRRLKLLVGAHAIWLFLTFGMGAWWATSIRSQAHRIAELESKAGLPNALENGERTHRMLRWEIPSYFVLLSAATALLYWLYWRDSKRTRGLQAFFASVTHELRTPLTSIRLQAESIAETADASQRALVDRLLEDTLRLEGQVERTLELARVEAGGKLFTEPLRLAPWIDRLLQEWKQGYAERVSFEARIEDLSVDADSGALQVILKNLLENTLRHSKTQKVRVLIEANGLPGSESVQLSFRDNGSGYSGNASQLGELFKRGPGSHGAGVGLYLIRMLMGRMGGEVQFVSGPGFETRLRFKRSHG